MMMNLLAYCEHASTVAKGCWELTKTHIRTWLGPEPQNWRLLADGRVLPSAVYLPDAVMAAAYLFDPYANRMILGVEQEGRFRPMPYLALAIEEEGVGITDISDWLGEIRANPVPISIPVRQIITLWSLVHNQYLPTTNVVVRYTRADGTEETANL